MVSDYQSEETIIAIALSFKMVKELGYCSQLLRSLVQCYHNKAIDIAKVLVSVSRSMYTCMFFQLLSIS